MYFLNINSAIKKMSVNEIRDFIFENCYKQIGFHKQLLFNEKKYPQLFSTKLTENISDPPDAKEHYQSFVRKKNTK